MKRTIKLLALVAMAAGVTFASCQKEENDNGGNAGNVEWVDLGLPSGLLWANCNLGATSPEEYGNYYAWGETRPKEVYSWSAYKYCTVDADGGLLTLTKYNFSADYGTPDSLFTLEAMDDAATAAFGSGARMPTSADWEELIRNTTVQWDTVNGIGGRTFTADNGNSIFLPAAGYHKDTSMELVGKSGGYWASTLSSYNPCMPEYVQFGKNGLNVLFGALRKSGQSVRAVRK